MGMRAIAAVESGEFLEAALTADSVASRCRSASVLPNGRRRECIPDVATRNVNIARVIAVCERVSLWELTRPAAGCELYPCSDGWG